MGATPLVTNYTPGLLRWAFPGPISLAVGESRSWEVVFRVKGPCNPILNCVAGDGEGPQGQPVHDEACAEFTTVPPEPGLRITKRLADPQHVPGVGGLIRFELVVQNTGNISLGALPVQDWYDSDCMAFAGASPAPDWVNPGTGEIHWGDAGPLAPGDAAVINVLMRGRAVCVPLTWNCARTWWEVNGQAELDDMDCAEVPIRGSGNRIYLPLVLKAP